mmetsp:Transcript_30685/g.41542  ORF Transcript_30685/g.41542 Transcript_30685/m.41542 type:complete len:106 (+) Transcript_30685:80-397(+)
MIALNNHVKSTYVVFNGFGSQLKRQCVRPWPSSITSTHTQLKCGNVGFSVQAHELPDSSSKVRRDFFSKEHRVHVVHVLPMFRVVGMVIGDDGGERTNDKGPNEG